MRTTCVRMIESRPEFSQLFHDARDWSPEQPVRKQSLSSQKEADS